MKNLNAQKGVLEGVLAMDAWGMFIVGAVIALVGIHLENIQMVGWGVGITLLVGMLMGLYITKHLEEKRAYIVNKGFFTGKLG